VVLKKIEQQLEKLVDGTFTRAFPSSIKPVELGKRIQREAEANTTIGVQGQILIPNKYTIYLSPEDLEQLQPTLKSTQRELESTIRHYAADDNCHFQGTLNVEIFPKSSIKTGALEIHSAFQENPKGIPPGSLVSENGERIIINEETLSFGRSNESTIQLVDAEVSRNHAEIRLLDASFFLIDLQSTNGTFVNGLKVNKHALLNFDQIKIGSTFYTFQTS